MSAFLSLGCLSLVRGVREEQVESISKEHEIRKPMKNCLRIKFVYFFITKIHKRLYNDLIADLFFFVKKRKFASKNEVRFLAVHSFPLRLSGVPIRGPRAYWSGAFINCGTETLIIVEAQNAYKNFWGGEFRDHYLKCSEKILVATCGNAFIFKSK